MDVTKKGDNSSHLQVAVSLFACLVDTRNTVKVAARVQQYMFLSLFLRNYRTIESAAAPSVTELVVPLDDNDIIIIFILIK